MPAPETRRRGLSVLSQPLFVSTGALAVRAGSNVGLIVATVANVERFLNWRVTKLGNSGALPRRWVRRVGRCRFGCDGVQASQPLLFADCIENLFPASCARAIFLRCSRRRLPSITSARPGRGRARRDTPDWTMPCQGWAPIAVHPRYGMGRHGRRQTNARCSQSSRAYPGHA